MFELTKQKKFNGNLELLLDIFGHILSIENLKSFWDIHNSLQMMLTPSKTGKLFVNGLVKLLHKLLMASNLALLQQTQQIISKVKGEAIDGELEKQSQILARLKHQLIYDGGVASVIAAADLAFEMDEFAVYFYLVSTLQPLIATIDWQHGERQVLLSAGDWVKSHSEVKHEFKQARVVASLKHHVNSMEDLAGFAPVFLTLRVIC